MFLIFEKILHVISGLRKYLFYLYIRNTKTVISLILKKIGRLIIWRKLLRSLNTYFSSVKVSCRFILSKYSVNRLRFKMVHNWRFCAHLKTFFWEWRNRFSETWSYFLESLCEQILKVKSIESHRIICLIYRTWIKQRSAVCSNVIFLQKHHKL